ncbi:protein phosphatase 1 regulatory subunit 35-like isoform X1 [Brachyhypopomus gauderio]|uniref:protein phosphatase 1 regulatory subunit 35-like isoform X1 n=1 Tax=Brachyhypopomus gauderio TaxID=698409 RepID=UPI004041B58C
MDVHSRASGESLVELAPPPLPLSPATPPPQCPELDLSITHLDQLDLSTHLEELQRPAGPGAGDRGRPCRRQRQVRFAVSPSRSVDQPVITMVIPESCVNQSRTEKPNSTGKQNVSAQSDLPRLEEAELNSTLALKAEIRQLEEVEFDAPKAVQEKLQNSILTQECIRVKASKGNTHTHTLTCTHKHTLTHTHVHTHTVTRTLTCTHTHTRTDAHSHVHTHTHVYSLTCTHTRTLTHMYTHTYTHSHVHTHTHCPFFFPLGLNFPRSQHMYRALVNVNLSHDQLISQVLQDRPALAPPTATYSSKFQTRPAEGPNLLAFYNTHQLIRETPLLPGDQISLASLRPVPRPSDTTFHLHERRRQWEA